MNNENYLGKDIFKLGFGLMRLPKTADGKIDIEHTSKMVDAFIDAGGTYFDTAYVYDNGDSEKAAKLALVERYPREKFTLATKLNTQVPGTDEEKAKQQFYTSLERTGAGYFDFYLLHALQRNNYKKYDEYHIWDFVRELKSKGLVKHYGFSFHGDPDLLEELLTNHSDVDFIQLQINYADWENPGVASRACYEIARKHNVPITIMEPIKGGALANPIQAVKDVFDSAKETYGEENFDKSENARKLSYASWAIRYAASLDGIITVLSGMSNLEQMEDNLSYMRNFKPLSDGEKEVIKKAQVALLSDNSIACTACHYCTDGCPQNIPIPEIFAVKNNLVRFKSWDGGKQDYATATINQGKASDCIECAACEGSCPQHLPIIKLLKDCRVMEA